MRSSRTLTPVTSTRHSCTLRAVFTGFDSQRTLPSPRTLKVRGVGMLPFPGGAPGAPAESFSATEPTNIWADFGNSYLARAEPLDIGYMEIPLGDPFPFTRILPESPASYPKFPFVANRASPTWTSNSAISDRYRTAGSAGRGLSRTRKMGFLPRLTVNDSLTVSKFSP